MKRYKMLEPDEAEPGAVLFEEVRDAQGTVLIPAGTVLTEGLLKSLRRRGVETLCIVNDQVSEADLAAERARWTKRLAILFRRSQSEPANKALMRHLIDYRTGSR